MWIGIANLLVGAGVALAPGMSGDLLSVRAWLDTWLAHGTSPYTRPDLLPNWPPYVLLPLAPLYAPPLWALPAIWLIVNVAATISACRYLARTFTASDEDAHTAFWMLLSLGAVRSGLWHGQLTTVAMVAGAWALQTRASAGAGLWLALSMVKPHVAVPFVTAVALARRAGALVVCAFALGLSWAIFAFTAHDSIGASVMAYLDVLQIYAGEGFRRSSSDVRSLAWRVLPWPASEAVAIAVVSGCAMIVAAVWWRFRGRAGVDARVFALVALWSLLAFDQQRYNMILAAPALMLLGLHLPTARYGLRLIHLLLVLEAGWIVGRVLPALDPRLEILYPAKNLPAVLVIVLFAWLARDTWISLESCPRSTTS